MARRGKGNDVALTNGLLADIRDLIRGTNDRLEIRVGRVEAGLYDLRTEVHELRGEMMAGLGRLEERIDHILTGPVGQSVREQGEAKNELRARVFRLKTRSAPGH